MLLKSTFNGSFLPLHLFQCKIKYNLTNNNSNKRERVSHLLELQMLKNKRDRKIIALNKINNLVFGIYLPIFGINIKVAPFVEESF